MGTINRTYSRKRDGPDATYLGISDDGIGTRVWRRENTEIVNGIY